jgi:hypothetical protein
MRARRAGLCVELHGLDFFCGFYPELAEGFLHQGRKVRVNKKTAAF